MHSSENLRYSLRYHVSWHSFSLSHCHLFLTFYLSSVFSTTFPQIGGTYTIYHFTSSFYRKYFNFPSQYLTSTYYLIQMRTNRKYLRSNKKVFELTNRNEHPNCIRFKSAPSSMDVEILCMTLNIKIITIITNRDDKLRRKRQKTHNDTLMRFSYKLY